MVRGNFLILVLVFSVELAAGTVEGIWKRQGEAVWIQFDANSTTGVVVRNDKKPDAVGFAVARNLEVKNAEKSIWKGEVFAPPLGEYKPADIMLLANGMMRFKVKVGFMSRSVDWQPVVDLPDE
ncbi:MAG: hypothetical protein P8O91_02480 [Luminiphilus sp.]|nr:hypothetical protein [Luminiphilus sp.]